MSSFFKFLRPVKAGLVAALLATSLSGQQLSWSPPVLSNPITLVASNTNRSLILTAGQDYIIQMPSTAITAEGGITIYGGNNVVLIGGEIRHDVAFGGGYQRGLYIRNWSGTFHIEGLLIHGSQLGEGIDVDTRTVGATLQVQNVRVDRVRGSYSGNHADVIQNWGGPTYYRIDRLTGYTNYQGLMMQPTQFGSPTVLADFRNMNLSGFDGLGCYMIYRTTTGTDDYILTNVWHNPNSSCGSPKGAYPHSDPEWNAINVGIPPGGDFVPASMVGVNYVSPGYAVVATAPATNNSTQFVNNSMASQTGTFTATYRATPSAGAMDGTVGLSLGSQTAFSGLATIVRFNTAGNIDARNGGAYAAASTIAYTGGQAYAFRVVVNVPAHTYSIYVTPPGGSELTVGTNYAFRTEQNTVTSLNNWVVAATNPPGGASLTVSNFVLAVGGPVAAPVFSPGGGTFANAQSVTITSGTSGATIRYTTNGTTPSQTVGTVYSGPVSIAATSTLKAIAYKSGMTDSTVTSATYTITTLINETFTTSPASNFTVVAGGTWAVSGGKYVLTNPAAGTPTLPNGNIATHATSLSGNWTLTVDGSTTATTSAWNDFSVLFGYQDANNYYYVSLNESNDAGTSGIFKFAAGVKTQLVDITSLITAGTTYAVKIVKSGSNYQAYQNNVLLATASDSTWTSGKVGFGTNNDGATFDNLLVTTP